MEPVENEMRYPHTGEYKHVKIETAQLITDNIQNHSIHIHKYLPSGKSGQKTELHSNNSPDPIQLFINPVIVIDKSGRALNFKNQHLKRASKDSIISGTRKNVNGERPSDHMLLSNNFKHDPEEDVFVFGQKIKPHKTILNRYNGAGPTGSEEKSSANNSQSFLSDDHHFLQGHRLGSRLGSYHHVPTSSSITTGVLNQSHVTDQAQKTKQAPANNYDIKERS